MAKQVDRQSGAALADGDTEAWRVFLARQIPKLYGLFMNRFMNRWPNPALAEELVQNTVFDAVRGRQTFDPAKGDPAQWLAGIARNNIRLEIRKRAARPGVNGDIARYLEEIDRRPLPNETSPATSKRSTAGPCRTRSSNGRRPPAWSGRPWGNCLKMRETC